MCWLHNLHTCIHGIGLHASGRFDTGNVRKDVKRIRSLIPVKTTAALPGNIVLGWFPPPSGMMLMAAFINKAQREIHKSVYTRVSHRRWRTKKQLRVLAAAAGEPGGLQGHSFHSQSHCPLLQMNTFTCSILDCCAASLKWTQQSRFNTMSLVLFFLDGLLRLIPCF